MSRVGKAPVKVPGSVKVQIRGQNVKCSSSKGELEFTVDPQIKVTFENDEIVCQPAGDGPNVPALWGLARAMINNMVVGLSEGFKKELTFIGVGYRAKVEGRKLVLNVGYSHPVEMDIPEGLTVQETDKKGTGLMIEGHDKQLLGEFTATVRRTRPPEPYKGKGIRYKDEYVRTKAGKKVGA